MSDVSERLSGVVVAAGRSQRMGFDKILTPLGGRPLLAHTLERMQKTELLDEIILVVRPGSEPEFEQVVAPLRSHGKIVLVPGGAQRQDSVQAGLAAVEDPDGFVAVHDAARPFVTRELFEVVLDAARSSGAAACGMPCSDTMKEVTTEGLVHATVDRSKLWAVQTPQIFKTQLLRDAYAAAVAHGEHFTDDTAVVEQFGQPVRIVLYNGLNMKVTTPSDWKLAQMHLVFGESSSGPGNDLRKYIHDLNNHLTPLMGYSYLIANEFPEDSRGRKFAVNIQMASERCQATSAGMQQLVRTMFPKNEEPQQMIG